MKLMLGLEGKYCLEMVRVVFSRVETIIQLKSDGLSFDYMHTSHFSFPYNQVYAHTHQIHSFLIFLWLKHGQKNSPAHTRIFFACTHHCFELNIFLHNIFFISSTKYALQKFVFCFEEPTKK